MAIWYFSKAITCGTIILSAALVYCIMLRNRREKKESDNADNNETIEVTITNTSSPNIHNERQIFTKNSVNPNSTPLISKVGQVVSPLSNQSRSNNPVKSPRSKRLYQIQSKDVEDCNPIIQSSARFFTRNAASETITLNNSASSFEYGCDNAQDNLNRSTVIHINNSIDLTNNKLQITVSNKLIKPSTLNIKILYDDMCSDDSSTKNRSADLINQPKR